MTSIQLRFGVCAGGVRQAHKTYSWHPAVRTMPLSCLIAGDVISVMTAAIGVMQNFDPNHAIKYDKINRVGMAITTNDNKG